MLDLPHFEVPICALCGNASHDWRLCPPCQSGSALTGVWAAGEYAGHLKQIIGSYKFEHARAAHKPLAGLLQTALPYLDDSWVVTAVPTTPQNIRARSFDHAWLLAQEVARQNALPITKTLLRKQNVQQRGRSRQERFKQAQMAFALHPHVRLQGKRVLVVDDVCTTGATLSAAAQLLTLAGAQEVWGAVVALRPLK